VLFRSPQNPKTPLLSTHVFNKKMLYKMMMSVPIIIQYINIT